MEQKRTFLHIRDLKVYRKLCRLHLDVCALSRGWPNYERFELAGQVRRASNSAPANLAEKHSDRHIRNKIEGVNRARGEALEVVHHLFIATMKGYVEEAVFEGFQERYEECVRMLNGLEKSLEQHLPEKDRRWPSAMAVWPEPYMSTEP